MWASPQAANPGVAAAPCKQRGYEGTHMSTLHLLHCKTFNSQICWNTPEDSTHTTLIPLENRFKRITINPRIHTPQHPQSSTSSPDQVWSTIWKTPRTPPQTSQPCTKLPNSPQLPVDKTLKASPSGRVSPGDPLLSQYRPLTPSDSLQTELMQLMLSTTPGISAFPDNPNNLLAWTATISGPAETPYAGLFFKLSFSFPTTYPYSAPTVLFKTPIYHPNVDFSGRICLDILKDKWSAVYNVQSVLLSLQSLLGEPNKYVLF